MSHGESFGKQQDRPCWHCRHFVAMTSASASCMHGGTAHARSMPGSGCSAHTLDPARAGSPKPQPVSFLDSWRLMPDHIERPVEVLVQMRLEFRVVVCTGDVDQAAAFAALDRASLKRHITVVIHARDELAREWGMRSLREVLDRDDPMGARAHALIALPGGDSWVRDLVRWARAERMPVWAPDRSAVAKIASRPAPVPARPSGWRNGQQHQWSRDPGRGTRMGGRSAPPSEG